MSTRVPIGDLPGWVIALIVVMSIAQVALDVYALVRLFRTPEDQLVFGKRWPWLLIILGVNLVGAIVFLAAGRTPAPLKDTVGVGPALQGGAPGPEPAAGTAVADLLYPTQDAGQEGAR